MTEPLEIDDELQALAKVALRDAFWCEYSQLVMKYMDAIGHDFDAFRYEDLSDMSNVASTDDQVMRDRLDIQHHLDPEYGGISYHDSIWEALSIKGHRIYINDLPYFRWDDERGWCYDTTL